MTELNMTQAYVVMMEGLCIPRAVFLEKELAEEFISGTPEHKSKIQPCMLLDRVKPNSDN